MLEVISRRIENLTKKVRVLWYQEVYRARVDACVMPFINGDVSLPQAYRLSDLMAERYGFSQSGFRGEVNRRMIEIAQNYSPTVGNKLHS
jgi:hypothetical protein